MKQRLRPFVAGLLLLGAYQGLSLLNHPHGTLGTDTGGKLATLRVMAERERFDPDIGYWAEAADPAGAVHPLAYTRKAGDRWVNVTTLPALWPGWWLYRLGGVRAALLVPMAGSVAAAFAARALVRRIAGYDDAGRWEWAAFALVGFASPMAVYALDFWEHSWGTALIGWAGVWVLDLASGRANPAVGGLVAGLLLGSAATMRTEALVFVAVAMMVAGVAVWHRLALPAGLFSSVALGLGSAVPWLLNAAVERALYGGVALRSSRAEETLVAAGSSAALRVEEAAVTVLSLTGRQMGLVVGAAFVALVLVALLRGRRKGGSATATRPDDRFAVTALVGAAILIAAVFWDGPGFVPGLLTAWPVVIAAWLAPRAGWPLLALAVPAIPVIVSTQFTGGALPQWGGRYLLGSGILLAACALAGLRQLVPGVTLGLAALSLVVTAGGWWWLHVRSHAVAETIATIESKPEEVIVSRVFHLAREGGATYGERRWLTAEPAELATAARVAAASDARSIAVVDYWSRRGEQPAEVGPYRVSGPAQRVAFFRGVDLVLIPYERSSTERPFPR